jgi:protein SCO1/2
MRLYYYRMNPAAAPVSDAPTARRPTFPAWMAVVSLATVLCVATAIWLRHPGDGSSFQYYGQWIGKEAPDFTLTNQDGEPASLSGLRGKLVLMTFGFTHCPNICPTTLANLAAICRGLPPADQDRVRVLFISVDPARDTPRVLKDYVGFYARGFTGLTGSADDIAKVAKEYGAYYEAVMQDSQISSNYYTINHSAYVYLIDPQGRFAVLYDNDKLLDHARMSQDIEHLLAVSAGR